MRRLGHCAFALAAVLGACGETKTPLRRAEIRKVSGSSAQIIAAPGQLPYCLAFTTSASGVIRQLTMSADNRSIECRAKKSIGGLTYRFPLNEGKVRIYVLFSDRKLNASSVAEQIVEKAAEPTLNVTDLRLPGRANAEVLEFSPEAEGEPTVGAVLGRNGEAADGGRRSGADGGR